MGFIAYYTFHLECTQQPYFDLNLERVNAKCKFLVLLAVYSGKSNERGCPTARVVIESNYAATLQNVLAHRSVKVTFIKMDPP